MASYQHAPPGGKVRQKKLSFGAAARQIETGRILTLFLAGTSRCAVRCPAHPRPPPDSRPEPPTGRLRQRGHRSAMSLPFKDDVKMRRRKMPANFSKEIWRIPPGFDACLNKPWNCCSQNCGSQNCGSNCPVPVLEVCPTGQK